MKLWPWHYWGPMFTVRWSFSRNSEGGFSVVLNGHFWYTSNLPQSHD